MKCCIPILLLLFIGACQNKTATSNKTAQLEWPDPILEAKIRDTLRTFPFIKRAEFYFDSLSNHKEGVTFTMDTFRGKIWPIAVYYKDNYFQKLYRFEITPATMEIKISNIESGEFISIEEYYELNPLDKF